MKQRLAIIGACTTLLFSFGAAAPASADNGPHVAGAGVVADGCAACHRTHTAQGAKILKTAMPGLCLTCHGSTGTGAATDVVDGLGYPTAARGATVGALRGGGFSFALISSAAPTGQGGPYNALATAAIPVLTAGAATTSAHTVDGTLGTAWGNGAINATATAGTAVNLTCGSCHDPHGNGNFRILKAIPTQSGVVAAGAVAISDEVSKVYTTTNYWNVQDTSASTVTTSYIANVAAWCTTCHTRYNANGQGSTNSGDAIYAYRHTSNVGVQGKAN